jgi:hypothetical protein
LTWEWRTALGQDAPVPTGEPKELDQLRIAHNVAIERGDQKAAEALREKIEARLDRTMSLKYDTGLQLVGVRRIGGVEPRIETWLAVDKPFVADLEFDVRSNVERREPLSSIPADTFDRDMSWPEPVPTKLWKPRHLYKTTTVLNHRIGIERYSGRWIPRETGSPFPHRVDNRPDTVLAVVE